MRAALTKTVTALAVVAALGAGCEREAVTPRALEPIVTTPEDHPFSDAQITCEGMRLLRVTPWPGGGLQLAVSFERPADLSQRGGDALALVGLPNSHPRLALGRIPDTPGLTGVVVAPAEDPTTHADRLDEARALIAELLARGDAVALWSGGPGTPLLADLTRDGAHLRARLDALAPAAADLDAEALAPIEEALTRLGGPWGTPLRELRVIGGPGGWTVDRDEAALIGACGPFPEGVTLSLERGDARCTFEAPRAIDHLRALPCDPLAAARDEYPFPDAIALRFTAAQRARFDEATEAEDQGVDLACEVVLGVGEALDARVRLRGQSSLGCARKSYVLNLKGPEPRRLAPGVADDEALLISLCLDRGYFRQVLANRLLRRLDLFPLDDRLVTLSIDGQARGVYLLLEKPADALRRDHIALTTVIRRRFDPENKPEDVMLPKDAAGQAGALDAYHALDATIDEVPPEDLPAALEARLDLSGYLRWLAFNSYLENGDYVDEAFFYGLSEAGGAYFRHHAWDSDDLFSACHHGGRFAYDDPVGLSYCAEGHLDRALFTSEAVYARYVDALEGLLTDELTPEAIGRELDLVREELSSRLDDEATCAAMVELPSESCAALRAAIEAQMETLRADVDRRATELREQIAAYREMR